MWAIETMVIEDPFWGFPLVELLGIKGHSFTSPIFLTGSLKRISINFSDEREQDLTAKQALWILLFTMVEQAILAFQYGEGEILYLSEHCTYLQGQSTVKELALKIHKPDRYQYNASGSKELAIGQLLSVTTQMKSFVLLVRTGGASLTWLTYLQDSFETLRELRILGVWPSIHYSQRLDYSLLKNLTTISLNKEGFKTLYNDNEFRLPGSLQVIEIPFSSFRDNQVEEKAEIKEEFHLASVLESHSLPNQREINAPFGHVDSKIDRNQL